MNEQQATTETAEARVIGQAARHLAECRAWELARKMVKGDLARRAVFRRLTTPPPGARVAGGVKAKGHG